MSYIHEQKRNGRIYVYEITSYWDKEKKQPRQKRVYLGTKDKAKGKLIEKKKNIPTNSRSIGSIHFLNEISQHLKLSKALKKIFQEDYEKILYLSFFKIIKREAYYLYPLWCEESYTPPSVHLTSRSIGELLSKIGKNEKDIERFFFEWISQNNSSSKVVMFDITSISSYCSGNDFLEWGYNRDGENLKQTNLGVLSRDLKISTKSRSASLPIGYRIYPGSINDVTTLRNIIGLVREYKLELSCLVLDKGFYSQENIRSLHAQGLSYIVPMSFSTKISKEVIDSLSKNLTSASSSFMCCGKAYWYHKKKIKVGGVNCQAHVYLDKLRRCNQESTLTEKISDFERIFSEKKFKTEIDCRDYMSETLRSQGKFFKIIRQGKNYCVERNVENIEKEINRMGVVILLTEEEAALTRDEVLYLYRNKDSIEKVFSSLKNDLSEHRNRTHSLKTMRGSLFINFISLILISWVDHLMKERNLYKNLSKVEVYRVLDRLRFYELATGSMVLGELSARQKSIFSAFGVDSNVRP